MTTAFPIHLKRNFRYFSAPFSNCRVFLEALEVIQDNNHSLRLEKNLKPFSGPARASESVVTGNGHW